MKLAQFFIESLSKKEADKTTAKYWSCKMWGKKPVSAITREGGPGSGRRPEGGGSKEKPEIKDSGSSVISTISNIGTVSGSIKGDSLHIGSADVSPEARGKGYGTKLYKGIVDHAFSKGLNVSSDETVEEPAVRVYDSLKKQGYKVKTNPNAKHGQLSDGSKYMYAPKGQSVFTISREADKTGVKTTHWFWASEHYANKVEAKPVVGEPEPKPLTQPDPSAEDQVNQILLDTPEIGGATLVNTLKAKGLAIVDQKDQVDAVKQEADALGANPQVLRNDIKKLKKKKYKGKERAKQIVAPQESLKDGFVRARFMEAEGGPAKSVQVHNRFRVALIQEGLGNLRDGFYYSAQAIQSAITAFEGKKCYADHPSRTEDMDRPERSVRDIIGHFENVSVQENEDGSQALVADLIILPDQPYEWARALVRQAVEYSSKYPDKDFIGLSINASGDAEAMEVEDFMKEGGIPESCKPKIMKAIEEGMTQVRVVHTIRDAISTDLVTEAGARGRVLEIMESERNKENDMANKNLFKENEDEALEPKKAPIAEEEKKENEDEAQDAPAKDDEHADEEQDKKLILDMIKKHMGEEEIDEEEAELAHKACEAYKEMGYSEEEAIKCSAHAMKLAKHMASKKAEAEKHEAEDEAKKEDESKHESEDEAKKEAEDEAKRESATMKLEARIALLETELKKRDLAVHMDKKLAESKLPRSVTDKIRAKSLKSEKEVDEAIKIYVEAFKEAGVGLGGESKAKPNFFIGSTEKQAIIAHKGPKVSFK